MLKPNGYVFFTMLSTKSWYWKYCSNKKIDNQGLTLIDSVIKRETVRNKNFILKQKKPGYSHDFKKNYFLNFCKSENDVKKKFKLFKPISIGYYDFALESTKFSEHHFTFFGKKITFKSKNKNIELLLNYHCGGAI